MTAAESVVGAAAIEALGPLFKVTEVFLWDDAMGGAPRTSRMLENFEENTTSSSTADINSSSNLITDEDVKLAQQMDALGLPISFSTTKQRNSIAIRRKRKGAHAKSGSTNTVANITSRVPGVSRISLLEEISSINLDDNTDLLCGKAAGVIRDCDAHEDHGRGDLQTGTESVSVAALIQRDPGEGKLGGDTETDITKTNHGETTWSPHGPVVKTKAQFSEQTLSSGCETSSNEDATYGGHHEELSQNSLLHHNNVEDSTTLGYVNGQNNANNSIKKLSSSSSSMESSDSSLSYTPEDSHMLDHSDNSTYYEFGDWRVVWDSFYNRYYFYSVSLQESTWYPPPGLEHFATCSSIYDSNVLPHRIADDHTGVEFTCDAVGNIELHGSHDRVTLFLDKDVECECLNHSSARITLSTMADDHAANLMSASSDGKTMNEEFDEGASIHTPIHHSTDEPSVNECHNIQEDTVRSPEECSLVEMPLGLVSSENATVSGLISSMVESECSDEIASRKKKREVERLQSQLALQGLDGGLPAYMVKYWCQRYSLFSQFDNGIKMDEEGWFSVTPESIARHHAARCGAGVIIDCFTGAGGNAIQFAMKSNHVIAMDIDPQKIDYAHHNAAVYGVSDLINFIRGDFFQMAPHLKGDVIFLSPPWGGPDYSKVQDYDIRTMLKPHDGQYLFEIARVIAPRVVMFLPRNVNINQLAELSLSVNPPWPVEVEKNFLNGRLKAITAYFSNPMLNLQEGAVP